MEQLPPDGFQSRAVKALTLSDVSGGSRGSWARTERLADLQSAVRNVSAIVRKGPEQVPLELPNLRRTGTGSPGDRGAVEEDPQNLRSNLGAAIEASGLKKILRTAGQQLTPEWEAVLPAIERKGPRTSLCRLSRFCSAKGSLLRPSMMRSSQSSGPTSRRRPWLQSGKGLCQGGVGLEYRLRDRSGVSRLAGDLIARRSGGQDDAPSRNCPPALRPISKRIWLGPRSQIPLIRMHAVAGSSPGRSSSAAIMSARPSISR